MADKNLFLKLQECVFQLGSLTTQRPGSLAVRDVFTLLEEIPWDGCWLQTLNELINLIVPHGLEIGYKHKKSRFQGQEGFELKTGLHSL